MRYFLEVSYKGTGYSGFQSQHNANTIQAEVEKALKILCKEKIELTGSSRTDAGVHAYQNYFHFDFKGELLQGLAYNLNAVLPGEIAVKKILEVKKDAHCRFDAISREYRYYISDAKNPFLKDRAFYYPYKIDLALMQTAASLIKEYSDFTSFSKRKTQVKTFKCTIMKSEWVKEDGCIIYKVKANRFLRGMVRALTATMLKIGRGNLTIDDFQRIIEGRDCSLSSFAVPPDGLFLMEVEFPKDYFLA